MLCPRLWPVRPARHAAHRLCVSGWWPARFCGAGCGRRAVSQRRNNAYVSGTGVQAAFVEYPRPLTQKEFNDLRDKLRELQERSGRRSSRREAERRSGQFTDRHQCRLDRRGREGGCGNPAETLLFAPRRNPNPAIAETVTVRVTLATNAEPGEREIRLATPTGLSNPLRFCVGQLPEFNKRETQTIPE